MSTLPPAEFMRDKTREEIEAELIDMLRQQRKPKTEPKETVVGRVVDAMLNAAILHPTADGGWASLGGDGDGGGCGDGGGGGD